MNKLINKYLTSMEFYVNFTLNENFEETIKSRFRDEFTYSSFSEGEKMRIDLALLFTWRNIAKMKNSANTNLLILDEIFDSSLDGTGTDEFLKILNTLGGENVFVISHKQDALADKFRQTIRFVKEKNFSHVATNGDCIEQMQKLKDEGKLVDSVVTDPPYHLTSIVERYGKDGSAPKDKDGLYQRQLEDLWERNGWWRYCF